ncbi:hypothetical protein DXC40_13050 [Anaerotruncus colihominis]|uniref:Phage tail protein n=1 Tax=Anaerotruncus colihominis TaxID=169435 RepID=A0A3E3II25_9FIRM|nr:hypothetical protein DXC40_13050 [Anaerotruncus colihominis]
MSSQAIFKSWKEGIILAEKNSIITKARRIALAKLTAGVIDTIPPVSFIALGDGGVNESGEPIAPDVEQEALTHEVCRYAVQKPVAFPVETTARFVIVIPEDEQAKTKFSEMGLVDTEGNFVAIKTMYVKQKDDDVEFSFTFDMEF